jgi:PAS domain-containing protein
MPPGEQKVSPDELATIERWIMVGAPTARPEPKSIGPGLGITPEERAHWAFQPIHRPDVPNMSTHPSGARVRSPIDAFILEAMPDGLALSPDATRFTVVRRAYFDLLGLPPTLEEMNRWLNDDGDDWYPRLLDTLLDSPHYGERWARHWLDVAGYADSEGYTVADTERLWAWKYRDWVIRALNEDKPFAQFLVEQLAGDELAGPRDGDLTAEQIDLLTATGFLRMAADGTGSGANDPEGRNQVMTDTLKILGTSLLALSLQCAQCHDHRYDPVPQTDYYALRAVFEPALDWKAWQTPSGRRISLYTTADRKQAEAIEAEAKLIADEKGKKQAEYMKQALDKELAEFDEPLRGQLRVAYETPKDKRTGAHQALLAKHPSVNITPGVLYQYLPKAAEDLKKFDARMSEVRAKKPVEEFLRALVEPPNHAPETKLFHRGDPQQPKETTVPAALTVTAPENQRPHFPLNDTTFPSTGRRLAYAKWLTSGQHPLIARVAVNRIWMHHFGQGLVNTPADFGKLGATPSHPKLLDWLADEFMRSGWSLKNMHRLIMSSTVWRQCSEVDGQDVAGSAASLDDANRFYWRKPLVRLEAEFIRDRMLAASGQLDRTLYGPPVEIKENDSGQVVVADQQKRRSLYIKIRRSRPVAMLQAFDAPVMETNCECRAVSTVATQSLMLINGEFILDQAARLAVRAAQEGQPATSAVMATLPEFSPVTATNWKFGYGHYDAESQRTASFQHLPHWTGSAWQGGPELPDAKLGWVHLTASGGHPDIAERAAIRRWIAPADGTVSVDGTLRHGSENGDGVCGRIVSSRSGLNGEWTAHHGSQNTAVSKLDVQTGDTIDFITDSITSHSFDSFSWSVTVTHSGVGGHKRLFTSQDEFRGPTATPAELMGQVIRAWKLALSRPPSSDELALAAEFLAKQIELLKRAPASLPARTPERQAMTNLCQALLSCNEFLYCD